MHLVSGFRDAEALNDPDWDAVRARTKDLPAVQKELETLRAAGK